MRKVVEYSLAAGLALCVMAGLHDVIALAAHGFDAAAAGLAGGR